jgi:ubiquinone/menaquinone biosynthesis C-methylase UbiE
MSRLKHQWSWATERLHFLYTTKERHMSDPQPGTEWPYQVDDAWSRAVFARRTGAGAAFFLQHLRPGMRLIDCGCGPGSITVDLAQAVTPGEAIGIDLREEALTHGRQLARDRGLSNVMFQVANVYQLPFPDAAFDAAFAGAVLQHLAAPLAALTEMRRVLTPGGVIGIMDGSSTITFRYPTNPLLEAWDKLRGRERAYRTGRPAEALQLRVLLREAGFTQTQASGAMTTEAGPPAGTLEETRRVAQNHVLQLRGVYGKLALEQGWVTPQELEQMAEALLAWGDAPDAFYARPGFTALGWA